MYKSIYIANDCIEFSSMRCTTTEKKPLRATLYSALAEAAEGREYYLISIIQRQLQMLGWVVAGHPVAQLLPSAIT